MKNFYFVAKFPDKPEWHKVTRIDWDDDLLQWIYLDKKMVRAEKLTLKIKTGEQNE